MVDPIEIQLDEIEQHVLKTQADVDRLMRDFSNPDSNKQILASSGIGGGGGGFMDQIIGKITGGKGAGLLGAGGAAGLAAAGIMKLADIIGDAIAQSKILTTVFGTIGKAELNCHIAIFLADAQDFRPRASTRQWSCCLRGLGSSRNRRGI